MAVSSCEFLGVAMRQRVAVKGRQQLAKGRDVVRMVLGGPYGRVNANANLSYAVPMSGPGGAATEPSLVTRPLAEILRDLNKRVPDKVLKTRNDEGVMLKYIPWYHANRMLSFYAPGWSGEVRSIVFASDSSTVSVVYRVTIRGSDGEAWRESSGTASLADTQYGDPVQKAEGMAFRRACARFGLGLYLYHEDEDL
nr:hypothetical protein PHYPA_001497 [Physcomitrium patens]